MTGKYGNEDSQPSQRSIDDHKPNPQTHTRERESKIQREREREKAITQCDATQRAPMRESSAMSPGAAPWQGRFAAAVPARLRRCSIPIDYCCCWPPPPLARPPSVQFWLRKGEKRH